MINKRYLILILGIAILVMILELSPFVNPLKIYNPIAGVYFEVHGTYAVAIDYTKQVVDIPSHFLLRPVTETATIGIRNKGDYIVEKINIPDTVNKINGESFLGFDSLKTVSGAKNVEIIGNRAFQGDDNLFEIPYFEKIEIINDYAFTDCNINNLKLPNSIKEIGNYAFENNKITQLDANLTNVKTGVHAFRGNPCEQELGPFVINNRGEMQTYYGNETTVIIPNSVNAIYGSFFDYGEDSENVEVYIPDTVTKITTDSFWFNNHGNVYIPDSVVDIAYYDDDEQFTFYNATIITTKGSYAEEFAKKYNIDYEIVDEIVIPED